MTENDPQLKIVSDPDDLKGTALERREWLRLLGGSGSLVLGASLAGCVGGSGGSDDDGNGGDGQDSTTGDENEGGSVQPPEELVLARAGDSEALDPHVGTASYSSMVMDLIYDPLVHLDFDGSIVPAVGKGWDVSEDGTEWTIELNDGPMFTNGSPVTAEDVAFTFTRMLENSPMSWAAGSMETIEPIDDTTVQFTFGSSHAPWRTYSAYAGYFGVLPQAVVEERGDQFASDPVGSGPYKLQEWVRDSQLTLERNDDWETPTLPEVEAESPPLPRKITFRVIPEETPRVQALLSGDVDMLIARDFPPRKLEQIQESNETTAEVFTSNNAGYVAFNMNLGPTADLKVRQALSHAIDRDRIIEDIYQGMGKKSDAPLSENLLGWAGDEIDGYEFDLERAGELLDEAGWTMGSGDTRQKDGEPLRLQVVSTNTPPPRAQLAEEMVAMLSDVGVDAELTTYEYNTAYAEVRKGETHLFYATASWFDPDVLTFAWHSSNAGASNLSFLENDEVDSLLEEGAATIDEQERAAVYAELQKTAMELVPCQPIMTYESAVGMRSAVSGYKQHPSLLTPIYHDVTLDD